MPQQPADPRQIRFSQNTVGPDHLDIQASMSQDGWRGDALDVVRQQDGTLTSMDNRRLRAARDAGLDRVQVRVHEAGKRLPADWVKRFSDPGQPAPTTWEEALRIRTAKQGGGFPELGTFELPRARGGVTPRTGGR